MKEDKQHIDYLQLIPKYLSGNTTTEEVKLLEVWVMASDENKKQFNAIKETWMLSGINDETPNIDVDKTWNETAELLFSETKVISLQSKQKKKNPLHFRIAAAIAMLLIAAIWMYQNSDFKDNRHLITQNEVEENILPDGTTISLNQYASFSYRSIKKAKQRRVELHGDAFFEVQRDTTQPFLIDVQDIEIEVLGTAFYVDARDNQSEIKVIVQSGSVAMSSGKEKIVLTKDQVGTYQKSTGFLKKSSNLNNNYLAWKTDILVFDQAKLKDVVYDLNRKFHTDISLANQALENCKITATFDKKSLDAVISIIEKTLKIKADKRGEAIVLLGNGCD